MIEDMTGRKFVEKIQNDYIRHDKELTASRPLSSRSHGRKSTPLPAAHDR